MYFMAEQVKAADTNCYVNFDTDPTGGLGHLRGVTIVPVAEVIANAVLDATVV